MSRRLVRTSRRNGFEEHKFRTEEPAGFDIKKSDPEIIRVD
jgi:hypothetical protein